MNNLADDCYDILYAVLTERVECEDQLLWSFSRRISWSMELSAFHSNSDVLVVQMILYIFLKKRH